MKRGDIVLWHAVRGDKLVTVMGIEDNIIKVKDESGIYWLASKCDVEENNEGKP